MTTGFSSHRISPFADAHRWTMLRLLILVVAIVGSASTGSGAAPIPSLQIATFSVDITPPLGEPVGLGIVPILKTMEHPLLARGILLKDTGEFGGKSGGGQGVVLCTLDWMEVHNESYDFLRRTIGKAAEVSSSRVALHCVHQHSAPAISAAAQRHQLAKTDPRRVATARYLEAVAEKLSRAVGQARGRFGAVTHIGTGKAIVDRVASNRRIEMSDGSIRVRSSSTRGKPQLRELPEGLIDPWVRTVSFHKGRRAVAYLHYYATHPMSFYGDGRISYDIPGIIRKRLDEKTGALHVYFTGCGGDIGMGKYNDGSRKARTELAARLQEGIERSIAELKQRPAEAMGWSVLAVPFPPRTDGPFTEALCRDVLADPTARFRRRLEAAIAVAWIERHEAQRPVELSCLRIGPVQILHLPGEPFVQYQLAAQKMQRDHFVCVAGYTDGGMGYIGGDRIYTDRGGYEQSYAFAGPSEQLMLDTIAEFLDGK